MDAVAEAGTEALRAFSHERTRVGSGVSGGGGLVDRWLTLDPALLGRTDH